MAIAAKKRINKKSIRIYPVAYMECCSNSCFPSPGCGLACGSCGPTCYGPPTPVCPPYGGGWGPIRYPN